MDPHRLLAAVKRRWPQEHGPEFVKQQMASILLEDADAADHGFQLGLPSLGLKLRARLGKEWREQHGLTPNITMRKLLEGEGCFVFVTMPNSNTSIAVKLDVAAMLQGASARSNPAPHSPAAALPASNSSSPNILQALTSAAAGSPKARAAGASAKVKVVPRPLAVKGSPKAVPASSSSPASGTSYSSSGLPNLPDTLDSPPPVKPSRMVPRPVSNAAAAQIDAGTSRAVPNSNGAAAALAGSGRVVAKASGRAAAGAWAEAGSNMAEAKAYADTPQWRELEAYARLLQLHANPQANRLLQCLVVDMLHRAVAAADGIVSKAFNVSVSAAEAGELLQSAWQRLYHGQRCPFGSLPELLEGQLQQPGQQRELLRHVQNKGGARVLLLTAAFKKQFVRAAPASAGSSSTAAAERAGARAPPSPHSSAAAAAASGPASSKAAAAAKRGASKSAAAAGGAVASVPKQQLLPFIQKWQFDRNVDFCHMKRALATKLVNGAADALGLVPLDLSRMQVHVAQAGDVFHQVWCNRHPNEAKAYKKMGDVLAGDAFFSMRDGPKHSNQLVQLDIISLAAAAEAAAGGGTAAGSGNVGGSSVAAAAANGAGMRGGVYSLQELEAAAAAAAADAAAQAVGLRVAQGALLATDLLGFAGIITWHETNEGVGLLRQQLACAMIGAAHPGLAEAAAAARPVLVETEESRYVMNPYTATSVMLTCWEQHHPGTSKPYSTLPEAFQGCRYLSLQPGAAWKVQLDIQQMVADCAATMRDLRGDWEAVAAAGAAAVAGHAAASVAAQPAEAVATAGGSEACGVPASSSRNELAGGSGGAVAVLQAGLNQNSAALDGFHSSSSYSSSSSPSAVASAAQLGQPQPQQQPAVPSMSQLLQLLAYAPPEICSSAGLVLVPEAAQSLLFANQEEDAAALQQLQQLAGSTAAAAYAAQGVTFVSDAAAASQVCDHLMACPILALSVCCCSNSSNSSGGSGSEVPVLLQVLAPPIVSGGAALEAAVYVFDVRGSQQQQQSAALLTLLSILLEDGRVVKLVDDAAHVASVVSRHFGISCQGLLDVAALQEMLAPAGLLEEDQYVGDGLTQGLRDTISRVKRASWKLLSSNKTSRALAACGAPQQQQPAAELVVAAGAAVRPLFSIVDNALQLLPLALMRRCKLAGA